MSNSITPRQVLAALESHGFKLTPTTEGFKSICPAHSGKSQSLSVGESSTGAVLIHCFSGCTYEDVLRALGLDPANGAKRIVATYDYDGFFETVRYDPKAFLQRRKTATGEWAWNLKGCALRLYRQDDLMKARPEKVFVVEGEKDVETLRRAGILGVTNHGGAGKWRKAHTAALVAAGVKSVLIIPDADEKGREHRDKVAASCKLAGLAAKVVELPQKDVSAYLGLGGDKAGLLKLAAAAADWTAPAEVLTADATNKRTFPRKDATALEAALAELKVKARFNLRAMRPELSSDGGETWTKTTDRSSADLRRLIADGFSYRLADNRGEAPLRYGKDSWDEHLNALLHHLEVDPFKVWLESLAAWDGTGRLHKVLGETLQAKDGPLARWASTYLCLGAVQRAYEPGGLLREIPILIGPQRVGKSQLLSNLLPTNHPDWFSDSISMADPTQKRVESMLGRVIVELSELTGFARAELESLKAFISRRDDGATRLAYRRDPETTLRRSILVGTSNDVECLPNDPSGNSRFVPVQCGEGSHVESYLADRRVQLWAEGLALYRKGERANLPREHMALQTEHGERHRRKDQIIEDAVHDIEGDGPYTMAEMCRLTTPAISGSDRRAVGRLADALRLEGWTKRRERDASGDLKYLWRR